MLKTLSVKFGENPFRVSYRQIYRNGKVNGFVVTTLCDAPQTDTFY